MYGALWKTWPKPKAPVNSTHACFSIVRNRITVMHVLLLINVYTQRAVTKYFQVSLKTDVIHQPLKIFVTLLKKKHLS